LADFEAVISRFLDWRLRYDERGEESETEFAVFAHGAD
jgi:hypothetical protein